MLPPAFTLCRSCYLFSVFGGACFVLGFFGLVGFVGVGFVWFWVFVPASVSILHMQLSFI